MHTIEHYDELIDRDPRQISGSWQTFQICCYFLCAISGYVCSILFFVIWNDLCGEHCPLWAELKRIYHIEKDDDVNEYQDVNSEIDNATLPMLRSVDNFDWTQEVTATFKFNGYCQWFHASCLLSCFFGVVWLTLFFMCGRGGYDNRMYYEPWRVVLPALIFNLLFTILVVSATACMLSGISHSVQNINEIATRLLAVHRNFPHSECDNLQEFLKIYNIHGHNVCRYLISLRIGSWIMMLFWIGGTILLILRVINIQDFRLMKVTLYEMSPEVFEAEALKRTHEERVEAPIPKKKMKLTDVICCCCAKKSKEE